VAFGVGAATVGFVPEVMAQSTAAGIIYGQVDNASGASIVILNTETGAKRTVSIDASGRYQATALPRVITKQLVRNGNVDRTDEFDVLAGQGVNVSFAAAAQSVQVSAPAPYRRIQHNNGAVSVPKNWPECRLNQTSARLLCWRRTQHAAIQPTVTQPASAVAAYLKIVLH
jgi:hypothetical protein